MSCTFILAFFLLESRQAGGVQLSKLNGDERNFEAIIDSAGELVSINGSRVTDVTSTSRSDTHNSNPTELVEDLRYVPLRGCTSVGCVKDYVQLVDAMYDWASLSNRSYTLSGVQITEYVLNMTSQKWLSKDEVNRDIWTHEIIISVPSTVDKNSPAFEWATLFLAGSTEMHNLELEQAGYLAAKTGSIAAVVKGIPNEEIVFKNDPSHLVRSEGYLQFFARYAFHFNDKPEWLLELPMVKSVVRAMDTITTFTNRKLGANVHRFGVSGHSKRGQVTWILPAVDSRVQAIIPVSFSLNLGMQSQHAYRSLGNPAFVAEPYRALFALPVDKSAYDFLDIVDAGRYMDQVTVPKLAVMGGNDDYHSIASESFFWKNLPEPKAYLYEPNVDHNMTWGSAVTATTAFMYSIIHDVEYPKIDWDINGQTGAITAQQLTNHTPTVTLWQATTCNNKRRDFRIITAGNVSECLECGFPLSEDRCYNEKVTWTSSKLAESNEKNTYVGHVEPPTDGRWAAFFMRFEYPPMKPELPPVKISTGTSVVPNTYPFEGCSGAECFGTRLALNQMQTS